MDDANVLNNIKYFQLLARQYPTISVASNRIITLQAILRLPKGTEHFLSDLHGEYEPFLHMLKNASGVIFEKINRLYSNVLPAKERRELATVIYYPEEKIEQIKLREEDIEAWYQKTIERQVSVCRVLASKYTQKRVRKILPCDYAQILYELLYFTDYNDNRHFYYKTLVGSILETGSADHVIIALSGLIQKLAINNLHILGDIYDRGPGAHIIMDALINYHQVDIQWGNHDILWMGAAAGSRVCIAQVLINTLKYGHIDTLEEGYGISLRELSSFAMAAYANDECGIFRPHMMEGIHYDSKSTDELAHMHKAIAVILFKLESELIERRPEFDMESRALINMVDWEKGTLSINGKAHALLDQHFPTIDKDDPAQLTEAEQDIIDHLRISFLRAGRLQEHARFLFSRGGMYKRANGNLLYHGCIPLNESGDFAKVTLQGETLQGRTLLQKSEALCRQGFFARFNTEEKRYGEDFIWYLWCGRLSPLFGKDRMATFERYFLSDADTWKEKKSPYYDHMDDADLARRILEEFSLDPDSGHIINGHVPIERKKGESPVKAGGRLLIIDGGLSRAYHEKTGTAGYTLISSSHDMNIVAHDTFTSVKNAILSDIDLHSQPEIIEVFEQRLMVGDTDEGCAITAQIQDLHALLHAFRSGIIKEIVDEERRG